MATRNTTPSSCRVPASTDSTDSTNNTARAGRQPSICQPRRRCSSACGCIRVDWTVQSWWSFARAYYVLPAEAFGPYFPSHTRTYTRSRAQVGRRLPASSRLCLLGLVARPPPQRPFRGRRSRHSCVRLTGEAPTSCIRWHLIVVVGEAGGRTRGRGSAANNMANRGDTYFYVRYWTCTSSGVNGKLTPADVRSRVCFWPASAPR